MTLKRIISEFVVIVVGVLVALGVDELRQGRQDAALAQQMLRMVAVEVNDNLTVLRARVAYHEAQVARLDSLQRTSDGETTDLSVQQVWASGFGLGLLRATAWETARVSDAVRHFDLGTTALLSITYSTQRFVVEGATTVGNQIFVPGAFRPGGAMGSLAYMAAANSALLQDAAPLEQFYISTLAHVESLLDEPLDLPVEVR